MLAGGLNISKFCRLNREERIYDDEEDLQLKEIREDYDFELNQQRFESEPESKRQNRFENKHDLELKKNNFEDENLNDEETFNNFMGKEICGKNGLKNEKSRSVIRSSPRLFQREKKELLLGKNVVLLSNFFPIVMIIITKQY